MTEVPIWLKALKILAWPVTKLLTVMMKGRAHAQPEQIDIGVNDLEMVQLMPTRKPGPMSSSKT